MKTFTIDRDLAWAIKGDRIEPVGGCHLWRGNTDCYGYGRLRDTDGRYVKAHRAAYFWANGPFDDSKLVCHHCDVRSCVNPEHLYLGSYADNNRDRCIRNPRAKADLGPVKRYRRCQYGRLHEAGFWRKVDKGSCWLWTGATFANGAGMASVGRTGRQAHRIAWEWSGGGPGNLFRVCRSPNCVKPEHYRLA
jgi:hypothetical protein